MRGTLAQAKDKDFKKQRASASMHRPPYHAAAGVVAKEIRIRHRGCAGFKESPLSRLSWGKDPAKGDRRWSASSNVEHNRN